MSDLDIRALQTAFTNWKTDRAPTAPDGEAFEQFALEQVLKDADLSDDEMETGHFGGRDDGGVDAMYLFVNRTLVQDDTELPDPVMKVDLFIVQAKYDNGFSETAIEKLHQFARDLLDFAQPVEKLTYLNSLARDAISRFRNTYERIMGSRHTFDLVFHYAIKGDKEPNSKVKVRAEKVVNYIKQQISAAKVQIEYWDCRRLLDTVRSAPTKAFTLKTTQQFSTGDSRAVVCLVRLRDLAGFLRDEHGAQRRSFLEPNVRAYQGKRNPVNKEIRDTLQRGQGEFWWFNNGVTILADGYNFTGPNLIVEKPQIVNGLQTSQEIFDYLSAVPHEDDDRNVLIRVIVPPDEITRSGIIKATNRQTAVAPISLHATDRLHFDIEDRFKLYGLYYDRRKGENRVLRRPIARIVSIPTLAKAVIAVLLQRPDDARARPQTMLSNDQTYERIFNDTYDRDLYVSCILIDRQVDNHLKAADITAEERRDARYFVDTWLGCLLAGKEEPTPDDLVAVLPRARSPIETGLLDRGTRAVLELYHELGGTDTIAKGPDLREELKARITVDLGKRS